MSKVKLGILIFVAVSFSAALVVHAQSDKSVQPSKIEQKAVSPQAKEDVEPVSIPDRSATEVPGQSYEMVMDALGELAGEYQWDSDRIPVTSADQLSATWISKSKNYMLEPGFVRASSVMPGDANADGFISIGDMVYLINFLFIGGPDPYSTQLGDANCDGTVDIADVNLVINYLFINGPPPCG